MAGSRSMPSSCRCPSSTPLISKQLMASSCSFGGSWMEQAVKRWSTWLFRIVPLLSLASHLILAVFADIRRHRDDGYRRNLVWVAYQLTDWAPAYVIGNLYIETSPREKMIFAFWVPFLLLHNARPDNISAYSMEDSGLSARLTIVFPFQTLGSIYLFYRYMFADCMLRWAFCIMMGLSIFKYVESAVALWRADIKNSFKQQQQHPSSFGDDYGGGRKPELNDEEALLVVAHDLFDICKGAFSDYPVDLSRHKTGISLFITGDWEIMCKVAEFELSLMYDILYTKAAVVHTWGGYAIRMMSPPLTAIALLLFGLQHKEGMPTEDEVISYVLLGTTLLLDVRWLFRTLASAWTRSFFKRMPNNWLRHEFWCRERWVKLRRFVVSLRLSRLSLWLWTCPCPKEPKNYRRWAGTFGQYNLFDQCTVGNRRNLYSIPGLTIESKGHSSSSGFEWKDNSRGLEIPYYVKKLVFMNICKHLFPAPEPASQHRRPDKQAVKYSPRSHEQQTDHWSYYQAWPKHYEQVNLWGNFHTDSPDNDEKAADIKHTDQSDEDMGFPLELQEVILIWHIATDIFLACKPSISCGNSEELAKAIEQMSDYMMFLVVKRPQMLPGLTLGGLHEKTCRAVELIWKVAIPTSHATKEKEVVATWMLKNRDDLNDPNSAIWGGIRKIEKENLNGPTMNMTTVWNGAQLAQMLLTPPSKGGESKITKKGTCTMKTRLEETVERLAYWIPDLQEPHRDMEGLLEFILDAWVRLLMFASIRCSRDSHAKQLSCGGELTTLVWIITEHAKKTVVKKHLKSLLH